MTMTVVSINDFPNELLDIIFRFLYEMHWGPFIWEIPGDDSAVGYWLGDPFDPFMFPFAQAKVCQRWCALLAHYPRYWTQIPIAVDPATTPSHHVPNYLAWSRDRSINVFVKSHSGVVFAGDLDEKSYIDAILPYISQHLYHIKTIQFSLRHACIPNLPRWLVGPANRLEFIHLSHEVTPCVIHAHDSDPQDDGDLEFRFSAPKLTSLTIDWRTFVQACSMNMSWLACAPELGCIDLTPPGHCSPMEDLSVEDTIQALSQCNHDFARLSVRRIPFADDDEYPEPPNTFGVYDSLELEGLKGTEVARFVSATGANFRLLTLKNCSLRGLGGFSTETLTLEDLDEDCNLTETFHDVGTFEVYIVNCPAFNDTFLDSMADSGFTGEDFPARGLRWLTLRQCTNFSVESLYRMVLLRRIAVEGSLQWDGAEDGPFSDDMNDLGPIVSLHVHDGPPLLDYDYRAKFEELVPNFHWTNAYGIDDTR